MYTLSRPRLRNLVAVPLAACLWCVPSPRVHAAAGGVPKTCAVRSDAMKVARECFTGDMRDEREPTRFVGLDESSPVGLSYCYNALVVPYPVVAERLSLLLIKDDAAGQPVARTYGVGVASLKKASIVNLKDLGAVCYTKDQRKSVCSKGFFGFGSTDLPFALALDADAKGYAVRGSVRDRARVEAPGVPGVTGAIAALDPTLDYISGQVRTRLVGRARVDLAKLKASPKIETRDELTQRSVQFRYCRLAFDGLNSKRHRPEPFAAEEKSVFEELDKRMIDPSATTELVRAPAERPPEAP